MNGVLFLAVVGVVIGYSQAVITGGWQEVATNDENIQQIADWAVAEMAMGSLIEIKHAEQQRGTSSLITDEIRYKLYEGDGKFSPDDLCCGWDELQAFTISGCRQRLNKYVQRTRICRLRWD